SRMRSTIQPRSARLRPPAPRLSRPQLRLVAAYASAVFLGAFLLFLVQPMFGRMVLPLLGGSPAVWNTCMLFFQAALLGGYLYAHLSGTRLRVRTQLILHLALMVAVVVLLPVSLRGAAPRSGDAPVAWLLGTMLVTVGPPFAVLAGTGPLLQRWFSRSGHPDAADPYWLYAASNLGSMLALLAYPVLLEPTLRLSGQSRTWAVGYAALALVVAGCVALVWRRQPADAGEAVDAVAADVPPAARPAARQKLVWVGLAFVPSSLLLGVTTYVTTDLTPVPLLWVLPLALYLLSFTLVFARAQLLPHRAMVAIQPSVLVVVVVLLYSGFVGKATLAVPLHLAGLFVTAMVAHGELARRRPDARYLTEFYLWISVGGVLGGVFNVLVAPVVFPELWEYPLLVALACLARPWPETRGTPRQRIFTAVRAVGFTAALLVILTSGTRLPPPFYLGALAVLMTLIAIGLGRAPLWLAACIGTVLLVRTVEVMREPGLLLAERSFYGHYKVVLQQSRRDGDFHVLRHGSTLHGAQSLDPARHREPLTYYLRRGPLGQTVAALGRPVGQRRVAVVGLGTGTTAAYGAPGDEWTFFEIDPGIERTARDPRYFTYLADSRARTRVVLGDARLSLARERQRKFDLIVLDAFNSDAIPTHLITREALGTYLDRLAPGGLISFHVSNRYLDLQSVVAALVAERGLAARVGSGPRDDRRRYETNSTWVVIGRTMADLGPLAADSAWNPPRNRARVAPWTDDYSSLLSVFDW
ncbi:MAG TPA: fused MFS/spermidine synthase, partial [Longimicrobium sp.]|nr:fused MFS/spermidine synthase [Longimicrobium sp.]